MIIDITRPIAPGMHTYPGDPPVEVIPISTVAAGSAAVSALHLGTHTGTHVDPPSHLIGGGRSVDQLDLDVLMGPATVIDLPGVGPITQQELAAATPAWCARMLLRTHAGELWEGMEPRTGYRSLTQGTAEWLAAAGVRLVGIDYLSVDAADRPDLPAHRALLAAAVIIVECLDLRAVAPGDYTLACLPLRLQRGDGAPARAVLTR